MTQPLDLAALRERCHDGPDGDNEISTGEIYALIREVERLRAERDDLKTALHDLVMLQAQDVIGCVPPPTRDQWAKAWAAAEKLVWVEK